MIRCRRRAAVRRLDASPVPRAADRKRVPDHVGVRWGVGAQRGARGLPGAARGPRKTSSHRGKRKPNQRSKPTP